MNSNGHIIGSSRWQMFCKIIALKNSQGNVCLGVSFLVKSQSEKFLKINKEFGALFPKKLQDEKTRS